jgi:hypothetical protein
MADWKKDFDYGVSGGLRHFTDNTSKIPASTIKKARKLVKKKQPATSIKKKKAY